MGPSRVIQEIHTLLPYMQFCATTPMQEAMCTTLVEAEQPYEGYSSYYAWLRRRYAEKRLRLERALAAAGIGSFKGEGGFFLIGDVSGIEVGFPPGGRAGGPGLGAGLFMAMTGRREP